MLTSGAHGGCSRQVPTSGAHVRCRRQVRTTGAHDRCARRVRTSGAHVRCSHQVLTSGAHVGCPRQVRTSGAHIRCSRRVPTSGAHDGCARLSRTAAAQAASNGGADKSRKAGRCAEEREHDRGCRRSGERRNCPSPRALGEQGPHRHREETDGWQNYRQVRVVVPCIGSVRGDGHNGPRGDADDDGGGVCEAGCSRVHALVLSAPARLWCSRPVRSAFRPAVRTRRAHPTCAPAVRTCRAHLALLTRLMEGPRTARRTGRSCRARA